jgi:Tol biopolymer transport system component
LSTWAPSDTLLAFVGYYPDENVYTVGLSGHEHLIAPAIVGNGPSSAQFSRDGAWLYFDGNTSAGNGWMAIYRARPDGSGITQLSSLGASYTSDQEPSPSPDNSLLVYVVTLSPYTHVNDTLRVLTIGTGASVSLSVAGATPRWSPVSNDIAYIGGDLKSVHVIHADGTGDRVVASGEDYSGGLLYSSISAGLDWSPDGAWLIVRGTNGLELIDPSGPRTIPLPNTGTLYGPSWRY